MHQADLIAQEYRGLTDLGNVVEIQLPISMSFRRASVCSCVCICAENAPMDFKAVDAQTSLSTLVRPLVADESLSTVQVVRTLKQEGMR